MRSLSVVTLGFVGALALAFGPTLLGGCSSSTNVGPRTDAGSSTDADSMVDGSTVDARGDGSVDGSSAIITKDGCKIERSAQCPLDDERGCSSAVTLKSGEYCTVYCEAPADCPQGVLCNSNAGVCLPPCTDDGSCTAMGFRRCDLQGKTCTTL